MSAVTDAYLWCSVVPGRFTDFPVKSGPNEDSIIITNGQHLICIVQVADQQTTKSWSAKQLLSFTCPAIFNHVKKQYCVVQNDHLLRQWNDDAVSLMNSHKTKFTEKIYTILDFHCVEPVIVFSKGDCQILGKAIETKKDAKHDYIQDANICWAAGYNDAMSYYIVLITAKKQSVECTVHWIRILKSDGLVNKHTCYSLNTHGGLPLSWCLKQDGEKPLLYVLWSNGELHSYDHENASKKILKIGSVTQNCSAVICSLHNSCIAIAIIPSNKGISDPILEIWDVKFSMKREERVLPFLTEGAQMNYANGVLFLLNANELRGIFCKLQPSSLASAIGSAEPFSRKNSDDSELVVEWTIQEKNGDVEEVNMECEKFEDLLQMESTGQTLPLLWKQLFSDFNRKSDVYLSTFESALERWKHIPEEILAKTLEFCLSAKSKSVARLAPEPIDIGEDCPFSCPQALFLNRLLSLPFNDIFIHKHIQAIPFQHIMVLLQYLLYLLSEERIQSVEKRPSAQVICSWLCVLLDAHFNSFILSKDEKVHRLILHLTDATKTMLQLYKDIENLEELLMFAREKLQSSQARPPTLYCIEMLCI